MGRIIRTLAPGLISVLIAFIPVPSGLAPHAWPFFAIFVGVVLALILEPIPAPAVGLLGVTIVAVLSHFALLNPAELGNQLGRPSPRAFHPLVHGAERRDDLSRHQNLLPLYGSQPHTPSARKIGGYVMWTALAD